MQPTFAVLRSFPVSDDFFEWNSSRVLPLRTDEGIPLRIEIGPRDIEAGVFAVNRRDLPFKEKLSLKEVELVQQVPQILDQMQKALFQKAKTFQTENYKNIESKEEFYKFFTPENSKKPEIHGGFAEVFFVDDPKIEDQIKQELGVTVRCFLLDKSIGKCIFTGKEGKKALFAKAY